MTQQRFHRFGFNVSAAARDGVSAAVRSTLASSDRAAYERNPEKVGTFWTAGEAWADE